MRRTIVLAAALGVFGLAWTAAAEDKKGEAKAGGKSAAALEKEKALRDPYPNDDPDLSVKELDKEYVAGLSKEHQEGYKLLLQKCSKCHTPSRPLNSQFLETPGKDAKEREANLKQWRAEHPDLFKNKKLFQPETDIWSRYVKRMMAKPGCDIAKDEGKKIWQFLVQDSVNRKTGKKMDDWKEHRTKLIEKFKKEHPDRYKELFGAEEGEKKAEKKG